MSSVEMIASLDDLSPSQFEDLVREALLHLYDSTYLQTHPLALLLAAPTGKEPGLRGRYLFQTLVGAIETLRPPEGTASDSRAWRSYRILELRYLEGQSAGDVLAQLAVSKTQYQRDHARALEAVASLLWDRLQATPAPSSERLLDERLVEGVPGEPEPGSREALALTETDQLAAQMSPDSVDLAAALSDLVALLQNAAVDVGTALSLESHERLPPVRGDRVALRQVFLSLLNTALERGEGGSVKVFLRLVGPSIEAHVAASEAHVAASEAHVAASEAHVAASPGQPMAAASRRQSPEQRSVGHAGLELEVARRFLAALGGSLEELASLPEGVWGAKVRLPIAQRPLVLVVDNNADFISLVARYLAEHDWQVVGAQDVRQAQALALEVRPSVVLLDVMLPGQDGWDLLLALRSRAETRQVPVIVCSVLYEPQVARALGTVGYLAKPISQEALLEALRPYRSSSPGSEPAC